MLKLVKKPDRERFEIVFFGTFLPSKFIPNWFAEKKLIGKKEAEEANIIEINQFHSVFSTKFIRIFVEEHEFRISSTQLISHDLVKDMAISIGKILVDSINNLVAINVKIHYKFDSKKEINDILNGMGNPTIFDNFKSPTISSLKLEEVIKKEKHQLHRSISLHPCPSEEDMPNNLHVYILNHKFINSTKAINGVLESTSDTLFESVEIINTIINKYFRK